MAPQSLDDARRRKPAATDQPNRVPPHNLEAEESLLGSMLLSPEAVASAVEVGIAAADFYKPAHGHVFDAIMALYARGERADPVTVDEELRRRDVLEQAGGPAAIIGLQANTPAIGNAARYALIVVEHSLLRRLIGVAGEIVEIGHSMPADVPAAIDEAESLVFSVRRATDSAGAVSLAEAVGPWLDVVELRAESGGVPAIPTGFADLDEHIGGLHPGRLVLVAGRPGMGKTSLGVALAANVAAHGLPVLLVSVEMALEEVVGRFIAARAQLEGSRIDRGRLYPTDWPRIHDAASWASRLPVEIVDSASATLMTVRAQARRVLARHRALGAIVVDYVQLMRHAQAENRQAEVAELAKGLRALGKELAVPVVALAQLNRGVEQRADKRPTLVDLRESGELENSADVVIMLYRDDHYRRDSPDAGIAELIIEKNRQGPKGVVRLAADLRTGRWSSLAQGALV